MIVSSFEIGYDYPARKRRMFYVLDGKEIKAVMCDVDGTLLTNQGVVSHNTVEAIKKLREKGILFGLCTGRDVPSVKDQLKEWGIEGLVDAIVGSGGSEVYDGTLQVDRSNYPLEGRFIKDIIKHYEDLEVNFAIPYQGLLFAPKEDALIKMLSKADGIPYRIVDFDEFLEEPKPKVMLVFEPDYMDTVLERSKTFHNEHYKSAGLITASVLYEYMDPRVSKTLGLTEIMELHGWSMENLCTFGDADNDHDMTQNAGIGVVMENGSELTKSVADYITDDNDHDGIATFITTYLL